MGDEEEKEEKADKDDKKKIIVVKLSTRLNNRVLDMRTPANQAIFRLSSAICMLFRNYLHK